MQQVNLFHPPTSRQLILCQQIQIQVEISTFTFWQPENKVHTAPSLSGHPLASPCTSQPLLLPPDLYLPTSGLWFSDCTSLLAALHCQPQSSGWRRASPCCTWGRESGNAGVLIVDILAFTARIRAGLHLVFLAPFLSIPPGCFLPFSWTVG